MLRSDEELEKMLRDALCEDGGVEDGAEMTELRDAFLEYKAETLRFAERKSAAMPTPRAGRVAALWDGTPRWALAGTAACALLFGAVFASHARNEPAPVAMAAAPNAEVLRDDNDLLLSVDEAVNNASSPNEEELGLTAIQAHRMKAGRVNY